MPRGQALLELCWSAPPSDPANPGDTESVNVGSTATAGDLAELAGTSVASIRDVFGIPHASFLIASLSESERGARRSHSD